MDTITKVFPAEGATVRVIPDAATSTHVRLDIGASGPGSVVTAILPWSVAAAICNQLAELLGWEFTTTDDGDDDEGRPTDTCGCGYTIVYTEEGWQHDAAPWFWGGDHDPHPSEAAQAAARAWDADHPDHDHDGEEDMDDDDINEHLRSEHGYEDVTFSGDEARQTHAGHHH